MSYIKIILVLMVTLASCDPDLIVRTLGGGIEGIVVERELTDQQMQVVTPEEWRTQGRDGNMEIAPNMLEILERLVREANPQLYAQPQLRLQFIGQTQPDDSDVSFTLGLSKMQPIYVTSSKAWMDHVCNYPCSMLLWVPEYMLTTDGFSEEILTKVQWYVEQLFGCDVTVTESSLADDSPVPQLHICTERGRRAYAADVPVLTIEPTYRLAYHMPQGDPVLDQLGLKYLWEPQMSESSNLSWESNHQNYGLHTIENLLNILPEMREILSEHLLTHRQRISMRESISRAIVSQRSMEACLACIPETYYVTHFEANPDYWEDYERMRSIGAAWFIDGREQGKVILSFCSINRANPVPIKCIDVQPDMQIPLPTLLKSLLNPMKPVEYGVPRTDTTSVQ